MVNRVPQVGTTKHVLRDVARTQPEKLNVSNMGTPKTLLVFFSTIYCHEACEPEIFSYCLQDIILSLVKPTKREEEVAPSSQ